MLVLVAIVALAMTAGSSVMARPGLWCSLATPCVAKSVEKAEPSERGWLGVEIQDLTPELREVLQSMKEAPRIKQGLARAMS
jgi:hypothetical protein